MAEPGLVVTRVLVRLRCLGGSLLPNPLPRWFSWRWESVRGGGSVVVLLLVDGDVETLHAGVVGVGSHSYGHGFAVIDQSTRFTLLLVLHCHHIDLLFIIIFVIFIICKGKGNLLNDMFD